MNKMYGISKYSNIGNTCYLNSILAILQQTPYLVDYFVSGIFIKDLNLKKNLTEDEKIIIMNKVYYQFYKLINASLKNNDRDIKPTTFKKLIGKKNSIWDNNNHQDSQEFFNFLISTLEEEIGKKKIFLFGRNFNYKKSNKNISQILLNIKAKNQYIKYIKKEYSMIKTIFTGLEHNKIECEFCKNTSNRFQIFTTLQIDIPQNNNTFSKEFTIYDCLDKMIKKETLTYSNRIRCELCNRKNKSNKINYIWMPPKVLVIHIKRFIRNNYGFINKKNTTKVNYPVKNLDIRKYISNDSPYINNTKYNLFAVNIHLGFSSSINFGHYISLVKNRLDNKWYVFNDSNNIIKVNSKSFLINKDAYLLFYLRTN